MAVTTASAAAIAPAAPTAPATQAEAAITPAPAIEQQAVPTMVPAQTARSVTATPQVTATPKLNFPLHAATSAHTGANAPHATPGADAGSIGGAVFSLMLVIGLILGLGWLAKRLPGMQRGAGTSQLKVIATVSLGPRERAVVIDVAGTQLLLGVGAGGVRTLHTLEQPLTVSEAVSPSPFAQVLAQQFGRKS